MKSKTPVHTRPTPTQLGEEESEIGVMASHIRQAAEFLMKEYEYSLKNLENLTGGSTKDGVGGRKKERLHKNSVMKIKDLRIGWTILRPLRAHEGVIYEEAVAAAKAAGVELDPSLKKPKLQWREGAKRSRGFLGSAGREQWLWNPQVDSFEKLERILVEARRLGFVPKEVVQEAPKEAPKAAPRKAVTRKRVSNATAATPELAKAPTA
jgi:hypothetical protein